MSETLLSKVGEVYLSTNSVKQTADLCALSEVKVRRILITLGLWSSSSSERVQYLVSLGYDTKSIADELCLSVKAVEAYLPYRRGVMELMKKRQKRYGANFIANEKVLLKRI